MLTAAELSRYARQLVLPEIGVAGQERLRTARALVVGVGGLGSPAALYLAAAGVGTIGLVDDDAVEISNLHRQVLHGTADIGRSKTESGAESLERLNPHVIVKPHRERLTRQRAEILLRDYDLVIDGSDNYATRYAINDASVVLGKTWIYGSVERFSGQLSVFGAPTGPCYRCIFPEAPAPGSTSNCEEIGVLGAIPGVIGALQAVEALKCLLGVGEPLIGRLLQIDFTTAEWRSISFEKRTDCPGCGDRIPASDTSVVEADMEPGQLVEKLAATAGFTLLDIREPWEWRVGRIGEPTFLPMGDLERSLATLDRTRELIVYCHHGTRSSVAAEWLRARGFRARNLAGGIDRWSREIDPSVPRY